MNMVMEITAPPAGGKTFTLKRMIPVWLSDDARVIVLTSGGEYQDVCTQAGGAYTTITEGFILDHLPDADLAVYNFDDTGFQNLPEDFPRKVLIQFSNVISNFRVLMSGSCTHYFVLDDWPAYSCTEDLVHQFADAIQHSNVTLVYAHQPFPYQFKRRGS